jgi:hypothetical protein
MYSTPLEDAYWAYMSPLYDKEMENMESVSDKMLEVFCKDFMKNREQLVAKRKQAVEDRKDQKRKKSAPDARAQADAPDVG